MKKALSAFVALALCISLSVPALALRYDVTFSDVGSNHFAYDAIHLMASLGIVSGVGEGRYDPEGQVSTAQFMTMMTRSFYADSADDFENQVGDWWGGYMRLAQISGILNGTTAGDTYAPVNGLDAWDTATVTAPINRYDMAQAMTNLLRYIVAEPTAEEKLAAQARISDYDSIPDRYRDVVAYVYHYHCLSGLDEAGRFGGNQSMTRAQSAVVLQRMLHLVNFPPDGSQQATQPTGPVQIPADANGDGVLTQEEVHAKLLEFQALYPDETPWDDDKFYAADSFNARAYGCAAFATQGSDFAFGTLPVRTITNARELRVGDIFHDDALGHWGIITEVSDGANYLTAEGNYNSSVIWNRPWEYAALETALEQGTTTIFTRYP